MPTAVPTAAVLNYERIEVVEDERGDSSVTVDLPASGSKRALDSSASSNDLPNAQSPAVKIPRRTASVVKHTVYINNLNDQISISDLRTSLYLLCSQFGHVIAINAHKAPRMRGQAHVVFAHSTSAAKALADLSGSEFLGKPIQISWARSESKRFHALESHLKRV